MCHGRTPLCQPKVQGKGRRLPSCAPAQSWEGQQQPWEMTCVQIVRKGRDPEENVELRKGLSLAVCL